MSTLTGADPQIQHVSFDDQYLIVHLQDGRRISTPLNWYPRLLAATRAQLDGWEIVTAGYGIHWEQLDEDLGVEEMLRGFPAAGYRSSVASMSK